MKVNLFLFLLLIVLITASLSGCDSESSTSNKEMPVVNDENCKPENIAKIEDKALQKRFAGKCLRRGPSFQTTEKKEW
jgi:entry exclusion lipoprotein TrbK